MTATAAIIAGTDGPSSFIARGSLGRGRFGWTSDDALSQGAPALGPLGPQQVGDQVDGAGGQRDAVGPRGGAGLLERPARVAHGPRRRAAELAAQRLQRPR